MKTNIYPVFTYVINLDERGCFYADVRDPQDKTVYEIRIEGNPENDSTIFEDGFMKHKHDTEGLREYLVSLGIMKEGQDLAIQA